MSQAGLITHQLIPTVGGTRLREIVSHIQGGTWYWRALFEFMVMPIFRRLYSRNLGAVRQRMAEDLAAGRIELLPPNQLDPQAAAAAAVAAGLAQPYRRYRRAGQPALDYQRGLIQVRRYPRRAHLDD
jgi:hypothetical protein